MIVKGVPEIDGIYLLKQNKEDKLTASIKKTNGRYLLNVKNDLEKNICRVEFAVTSVPNKKLIQDFDISENGVIMPYFLTVDDHALEK